MLRRASTPSEPRLWRREMRSTLLLAYPLILTNLAQAAIHATDVVLLGWVGPRALAAGALGVNLFNACLIFGLGLVTASAPMMARELGRFRLSVRDVRRTVRQAMWAAVAITIPSGCSSGRPSRSSSPSARSRPSPSCGGCSPISSS